MVRWLGNHLKYAFLGVIFIIFNLHVQKKMQAAMDHKIGSGRVIAISYRNNLPYTNSVINKIQRIANLLPMNLLHETLCPVQMGKWTLPAHIAVMAQISNVLHDDKMSACPKHASYLDDNRTRELQTLNPALLMRARCSE
ncbi:hypothetical protein KIN20_034921 [Parelaphostrongylus tenuis]|uniref:Uncharacterized protein n=1 Tax=Parelaphostrongylus tenuis TaxID=148309 RepID=A0AAD5RAG0_PARTN|nr:hypothetical protein KIN20_034921 [Parelaphostrongylus tenuis]